jgi:hypothetical protein
MNQIKIIKKKAITRNSNPVQNHREPSAKEFELGCTVKSWVADWRSRKEVERQSAFKELTRLKQELY